MDEKRLMPCLAHSDSTGISAATCVTVVSVVLFLPESVALSPWQIRRP